METATDLTSLTRPEVGLPYKNECISSPLYRQTTGNELRHAECVTSGHTECITSGVKIAEREAVTRSSRVEISSASVRRVCGFPDCVKVEREGLLDTNVDMNANLLLQRELDITTELVWIIWGIVQEFSQETFFKNSKQCLIPTYTYVVFVT